MIKVLHISLHDRAWGSGSEARLLHDALPSMGVQSELWVSEMSSRSDSFNIAQLQEQPAEQGNSALTREDLMQLFAKCDLTKVDVFHIHLIGAYFSPLLLPFLQIKPVVLSVYDSSLYTGGCSHTAHCSRWLYQQCADCPLYPNNLKAQTEQKNLFILKAGLYASQKLQVVYYNDWQYQQLQQSILKGQPLVKLPQLYKTSAFYAGDKAAARRNLGLSPDHCVLFLQGAEQSVLNQRFLALTKAAIKHLRQRKYKVTLVYRGKDSLPGGMADETRRLDEFLAPELLGEYYRGADINLYFNGLDQTYSALLETMACALPSVVFDLGAARTVLDEEAGFFIPQFDQAALNESLERYFSDKKLRVRFADKLAQRQSKLILHDSLREYTRFYEMISGKQAGTLAASGTRQSAGDAILPDSLLQSGWDAVAAFLEDKLAAIDKQSRKNTFIDQFFRAVFAQVDLKIDKTAVWQAVKLWLTYRKLSGNISFTESEERVAHLHVSDTLRDRLTEYFQITTLAEFKIVDQEHSAPVTQLWRFVFLNVTSVLHVDTKEYVCQESLLKEERQTGYPYFFIKTMYHPYAEKAYELDIDAVIHAGLPLSLKITIMLWLTTAPLYSGTEFHRQHVLKYVALISKNMAADLKILSPDLCIMFIEHFVMALWRVSYLGGNNVEALREYGRFIRKNVAYRYPQFCVPVKERKRKKNEKLRIGYLSMNFRNQAVSQYMANRLFHHDKEKFWVKTFILKRNSDEMTEQIKNASDAWEEFDNLLDFANIAKRVKESKLDLLIFADIGMDVLTYTLGAMNLAPKQAVLVGHGTTTGLATLDYYISGDHEAANAQQHYVEKLLRLPNAGVAQLPPNQSDSKMTRASIGVPDDAVVFLSCANGIKHYYDRDELLIEILQKAPNAYIVLKPFQSPGTVDLKFMERVNAKARAAGVDKRLIQLPPLPNSGDLMGLIVLADVQLDTYPYGGWTTNLEALYYNLPIVTQVGELARTRWGAGLLRCLGIEEGIAANRQEYVEWAVRFAKDNELRLKIQNRIKEKGPAILFNGAAAQASYEAMLLQMISEKKRVKK